MVYVLVFWVTVLQDGGGWVAQNSMERCMSCISKLGALSRSSTMAQTPGTPAWTSDSNNACKVLSFDNFMTYFSCCISYESSGTYYEMSDEVSVIQTMAFLLLSHIQQSK